MTDDHPASDTSAFEVSDLAAWEAFAVDVLGLEIAGRREDGAFALRMRRARGARFFVTPGRRTNLASSAGRSTTRRRSTRSSTRLRGGRRRGARGERRRGATARGVAAPREASTIPRGNPLRGLLRRRAGRDAVPSRTSCRAVRRRRAGARPRRHPRRHDQEESTRFYCDVLGFRLSRPHRRASSTATRSTSRSSTPTRATTRSPSATQQRKRIHHFMLEVALDGRRRASRSTARSATACGSCRRSGSTPTTGCSRSTRKTPSGFQFELGWGGTQVDDATWAPTTYDHISEWGHQPPAVRSRRPRRALAQSAGSTEKTE